MPSCILKQLPAELAVEAAVHAVEVSPANAPGQSPGLVLPPQHIALLTTKYWGPKPRTLTVSFLDGGSATLRTRIVQHLNAWYTGGAGVRFAQTAGTGQVRIVRAPDGYWSYLGTDISRIPLSEPTMCLEGFSTGTPSSEYRRVVRHEAGHTLGFVHEHMRRDVVSGVDPQRAYQYFWQTQGWDRQTVDEQVLTPLEDTALYVSSGVSDRVSVMCYQLPGYIMKDGQPVLGGEDIDAQDQALARQIYPRR